MGRTDKEIYRVIDNVNSYYRINSESKKELLLNKYPNAAAAYSLRLLDGYYRGPLVRVRDEDGVEVDVYPDYNNELSLDSLVTNVSEADDTTTNPEVDNDEYNAVFNLGLQSLGEFVHDDAYDSVNEAVTATVCVWYDQSSNENHAKQVVATKQPKIYTGGALVLENGKEALAMNGMQFLRTNASLTTEDVTLFTVYSADASRATQEVAGIGERASSKMRANIVLTDKHTTSIYNNNLLYDTNAGTQVLHTSVYDYPSTIEGAINGGTFNTKAVTMLQPSSPIIYVGESSTTSTVTTMFGKVQEVIIYTSDQSSNRQGIEQDINNHYQIEGYTPPEPLIDLTKRLATEAGDPESEGTPAAAYSLRKLSSSYSGPLVRVRRSTDNTEVDVYPDDKGAFSVLSTIVDGGDEISTGVSGGSTTKTKLYEFVYGQECDLTVVVWYDQASNNDATREATSAQPKIYDSVTGVVTENGKAAVEFSSGLNRMDSISNIGISGTGDRTQFIVGVCTNVSSNLNSTILSYGADTAGEAWQNTFEPAVRVSAGYQEFSGTSSNTQHLYTSALVSGSNVTDTDMFIDRSAATAGAAASRNLNTTNSTLKLGATASGSSAFDGKIQEIIVYANDQVTSNRTGIETNINDYYNIY